MNLQRRIQGWSDSPLSETGNIQAMQRAKEFEQIKYSATVYSSDLMRATSTAKHFIIRNRDTTSTQLKTDPRLRERSYGHLEGTSVEEYLRTYWHDWHCVDEETRWTRTHGINEESPRDVLKRAMDFITSLSSTNSQSGEEEDETFLCFSHSGLMRVLTAHLMKESMNDILGYENLGFVKLYINTATIEIVEHCGLRRSQ